MSTVRTPLEEAIATSKSNRNARPPVRGAENRLEPECWPALNPGFTFDQDSGMFVIGSCFATNIENYLEARGYTMLSRNAIKGSSVLPGHLNKYTPAAIHQEVSWARAIYDRDDRMTEEDARAVLFICEDGRAIDTQLHVFEQKPLEEAIERRRVVYQTYRNLFRADVVVITLGLIEAWWDDVLKIYIQETPTRPMQREAGRFFFERLSFAKCMGFMRETIELITRDRSPNILITTSPVVLSRTYTSDDVLIANTHSKAVLRAVTGELVAEYPTLDYFPSFESVMLTRSNSVWQDDLKHVSEQFIHRIMARVEETYTGVDTSQERMLGDLEGRFIEAVQAHDFAAAGAAYDQIVSPLTHTSDNFHTLAAVVAAERGQTDLARAHLEADTGEKDKAGLNQLEFLRYSVWKQIGGRELGEKWLDENLRRRNWFRASVVHRSTRWLLTERKSEDAVEILMKVDPAKVKASALLNRFAEILNRHGQRPLALEFLTHVPENERIELKDRSAPRLARAGGMLGRLFG
ncbi:GSCFA domain-containing protein [Paroceanicella profunda]|nr:GSCFA domain-containing protein [Paroceanicella profunda]